MFGIDTWRSPEFLYLLLLIPLLIVWYIFRERKSHPELRFSGITAFKNLGKSTKAGLRHSMFVLRMLALALLIIALARPQAVSSKKNVNIQGIDIVLALDVSGSMRARDFTPDRIGAAKKIAGQFIREHPNDRIGLVIFSGVAFTQAPLTTDHSMVIKLLDEVKSGMIEDGTAIGDGLATAVSRLQDSKAKSKVIILLTDGVNNMGSIDPQSAAEMAKLYGIRVYTIGIGTEGYAPYPVQTPYGIQMQQMKVQIDQDLLKKIAAETGGKYYRAENNDKLKSVFGDISKLEKSKITVHQFEKKTELFFPFALLALILFVLEVSLRYLVFRKLP
ncbi:MAG: VWA domain-containing protein [Bacteroidales bacterium]|nr:VWA domain-containing protein [Bacteroidales bacterium]